MVFCMVGFFSFSCKNFLDIVCAKIIYNIFYVTVLLECLEAMAAYVSTVVKKDCQPCSLMFDVP